MKKKCNDIASVMCGVKFLEDYVESLLGKIKHSTAKIELLEKSNQKKKKKKKKKTNTRGSKYYKIHRDMAIMLADEKCEKCGDSEFIQVHHIIHRSKGGSDDISNLMVLCELCHMKEHEGEPVHNLMLSRYRKRLAGKI